MTNAEMNPTPSRPCLVLGFDPGGEGRFGWCVALSESGQPLRFPDDGDGCADNAAGALREVEKRIGRLSTVAPAAAGIDAPLFWRTDRDRGVDRVVRTAIRLQGCKTPGGTVQHVNSLRGACLVQGMMIALLLQEKWPGIALTEAHPKALLWLLPKSDPQLTAPQDGSTTHQRDARLAALAAWKMASGASDWLNLREAVETAPISPLDPCPAYMMPNTTEIQRSLKELTE